MVLKLSWISLEASELVNEVVFKLYLRTTREVLVTNSEIEIFNNFRHFSTQLPIFQGALREQIENLDALYFVFNH